MDKSKLSNEEIEKWYALDLPEISPPLFSNSFALFSLGFLFVAVVYSAFVEVPSISEVTGKLILENPSIPVRALQAMTVSKNQLEENKIVAAGEILVSSSYGNTPDYVDALKRLSQKIDTLVVAKNFCGECFDKIYYEVQNIDSLKEKRQFTELFDYLKAQKNEVYQFKTAYQKTGVEMNRLYGEISKLDSYLNPKNRSIASSVSAKQKADLTKRRSDLIALYSKNQQVMQPLQEQYTLFKRKLDEQNKVSKVRLNEMESRESIRAPISGKVINVKIKGAGEYVAPGQVVFEIVPDKNELMVMMEVSNRDISSIKVGSNVDIVFDAFPEYDYGKVNAKVTKILEPEASEGFNQQQKGFRIQARLEKQEVTSKKQKFSLLNGMTLKGRIYKDKETMLMSFLKTVFKFKSEIKS